MVRGRNSIIYDDIMVQSKLNSGNHTVSDLRLENSVCHDHLLYKHSNIKGFNMGGYIQKYMKQVITLINTIYVHTMYK
jgi:hypothetical protein